MSSYISTCSEFQRAEKVPVLELKDARQLAKKWGNCSYLVEKWGYPYYNFLVILKSLQFNNFRKRRVGPRLSRH